MPRLQTQMTDFSLSRRKKKAAPLLRQQPSFSFVIFFKNDPNAD